MASTTDRLAIRFVVQEYPDGRKWIELESVDGSLLPGLGNSFLGLDVKEGTDAEKVAAFLNERVEGVLHVRMFREVAQRRVF